MDEVSSTELRRIWAELQEVSDEVTVAGGHVIASGCDAAGLLLAVVGRVRDLADDVWITSESADDEA